MSKTNFTDLADAHRKLVAGELTAADIPALHALVDKATQPLVEASVREALGKAHIAKVANYDRATQPESMRTGRWTMAGIEKAAPPEARQ